MDIFMNDKIKQSILNKSRKDKFVFTLTLPEAMRDISYSKTENRDDDHVIPDTLQYSVYGVVLPEVRVDSGEIRYSGQAVKFSAHSRPAYSNIKMNFTVDNRFNNYWVVWKWLDILNDDRDAIFYSKNPNNIKNSSDNSMFKKYQGTGTIHVLDEYNQPTVKFDYFGLIPVAIGNIDYNYRSTDTIDTTFEFSFSKLTPNLL